MKYSHRLSDAVHILAYLVIYEGQPVNSQDLASSLDANPSLVRRLVAQLIKAEILKPKASGIAPTLARPINAITLLDVYQAVETNQHLLHVDEQTNQQCPVGKNIQPTLTQAYQQVQQAAEMAMQQITLQDIVDDLKQRINKADNH